MKSFFPNLQTNIKQTKQAFEKPVPFLNIDTS